MEGTYRPKEGDVPGRPVSRSSNLGLPGKSFSGKRPSDPANPLSPELREPEENIPRPSGPQCQPRGRGGNFNVQPGGENRSTVDNRHAQARRVEPIVQPACPRQERWSCASPYPPRPRSAACEHPEPLREVFSADFPASAPLHPARNSPGRGGQISVAHFSSTNFSRARTMGALGPQVIRSTNSFPGHGVSARAPRHPCQPYRLVGT